MKFIGLPKKIHHGSNRISAGIGTGIIILLAFSCVVGADSLLSDGPDMSGVDEVYETEMTSVEPEETTTETTVPTSEEIIAGGASIDEIPDDTTVADPDATTDPSSETTPVDPANSTFPGGEATATPVPTPSWTETPKSGTYYVNGEVNVRSGPGTEYEITKTLKAGDAIEVVAVTSNGWYRTVRDTYVLASLCLDEKPVTPTPTPKPKPTPTPTPKSPTKAPEATPTPKPTTAPTPTPRPAPEPGTMTLIGDDFKVTFYGPQNGSRRTASGSQATEGRTIAADTSILPFGTVIYIENDPLGGDGYYTVEDTGSAVKGHIIDIFAEDGETGNHPTLNNVRI